MTNINTMNKTYDRTPFKIRTLWNTAFQLIGEYDKFEKKIAALEKQIADLSSRLNSTISGTPNV